ncbi:MAG: hypothetical protein KDA75_16605 [Planctomycetaceae bacterium]|nr:hypothetical protein [Planctomycetaceae bacterium]
MGETVGQLIRETTDGRPFIFVIIDYKKKDFFWQSLRSIVESETNHLCVRALEAGASGHSLLDKIHHMIDRAELIIAEITTDSPNVFYEIGYTIGRNRPLLLLAEEGVPVPTDLKGYELISYSDAAGALDTLATNLKRPLQSRITSRLALLRDMLMADKPTPAYIAASPRRVTHKERTAGQLRSQMHHRTFGDNVGIRGVLEAFGFQFGADSGVELISAQFAPPNFLDEPVNLYLIGSKKVNPLSGIVLEMIQPTEAPTWYFGSLAQAKQSQKFVFNDERHELEAEEDYNCRLYRRVGHRYIAMPNEMLTFADKTPYHKRDYGLVVRVPHPMHPDRLVLIMAGPHSLGSAAAGMAATNAAIIHQLRELLKKTCKVDLADKSVPIWALVEGTASDVDGGLEPSGVKIVDVGIFPPLVRTASRRKITKVTPMMRARKNSATGKVVATGRSGKKAVVKRRPKTSGRKRGR